MFQSLFKLKQVIYYFNYNDVSKKIAFIEEII